MAVCRVTVSEVKEIFDTNIDSGKIQACIKSANILVTRKIAVLGELETDELKEIERWLAAHFASIQDPVALRERVGDAEQWSFPASVTTAWGKGFNLTPYGQQAIALDSTNTLATLAAGLIKGKFRASPRENSSNFTPGLT
jgi:hypothetical protein